MSVTRPLLKTPQKDLCPEPSTYLFIVVECDHAHMWFPGQGGRGCTGINQSLDGEGDRVIIPALSLLTTRSASAWERHAALPVKWAGLSATFLLGHCLAVEGLSNRVSESTLSEPGSQAFPCRRQEDNPEDRKMKILKRMITKFMQTDGLPLTTAPEAAMNPAGWLRSRHVL